MNPSRFLLAALPLFLCAVLHSPAAPSEEHGPDYLDDYSPRTRAWVDAQTAQTLQTLRADARFAAFETAAGVILTDAQRLSPVTFNGDFVYQYWQTKDRPLGEWRRTARSDYLDGSPRWQTVIDVQALATAEKAKFIFAGASCREQRCLIHLSRNGKDADETREFDLGTLKFVRDGFRVAESKTESWWYDADTLIVAPAFARAEMNEGLMPRTLKLWKRGTALSRAHKVFEGQDADSGLNAALVRTGGSASFLAVRHLDFDHREYYLVSVDGQSRPLALPQTAEIMGTHAGQLLIRPNRDWITGTGLTVPRGSLAAIDLDDLMQRARVGTVQILYLPGGDDAIRGTQSDDHRLIVELLHDYASRLVVLTPRPEGGWDARDLPLPAGRFVEVMDVSAGHLLLREQSPLSPERIVQFDAQSGAEQRVLYEQPAQFDASRLLTEVNQARSPDGTLISYSVTRRRDLPLNHCAPTLVYGYGGYDVPVTPRYEPLFGKLWMERGGVYVHAYLRGGGERAPDWHWNVMRAQRPRVYDDMAAILRDLHSRGVSQPRHIGIIGRSNGGLMTAAVMERFPDLLNAVIVGGPLTDMLNFVNFPPGSTWTSEYGDPRRDTDREYLSAYSPMQNIAAGAVRYPKALIITATDDDRVRPGQARRFAALLQEKGHDNLYYEDAQGGHYWELAGGPAPGDWRLRATARAVEFTYLWQQLGSDTCR